MMTSVPEATRSVARAVWPSLLHRAVKTIRGRELFDRGQHLLVAVSGGPDSIALLSLLHRLRQSWRLTLTAVHCNYGLRGTESEGDQEFVDTMCRRLEIPLHVRRLDVCARARGTSLQAAARELRYGAMMETAQKCGADRIAVGHTADDQAETVLLWMLRGAGLSGLSGMPAGRNGVIVRPLYETRRRDILAYLHSEGVPYRMDSSNDKPLYLRNRIRQDIIPALQRVSPSAVEALCRLADICGEDDRYLDEQVAAQCERWISRLSDGSRSIDRLFLRQLPRAAQRRVVRNLWRQSDARHRSPSIHSVERLLRIVAGRTTVSDVAISPAGVTVERDCVRFSAPNPRNPSHDRPCRTGPTVLAVPGQLIWEETEQLIRARRLPRTHIQEPARDRSRIVVDADRLSEPLVVRAWEPGDRFCPLGMNGRSKKLQDYFTDLKVSGEDRRRIPVIAAPEGIVWIVGYRQDGRWSADEATERCLVLTVQDRYAEKRT